MRNVGRRDLYEDLCRYWREARRELQELRELRVQKGAVDFAIRERVLTRELVELGRAVCRCDGGDGPRQDG
jgi:hypothetical protein